MILHLEEMNKFGFASTSLDDIVQVLLRLLDEFLDAQLVSKHTILFVVLEYTKVRFSGHK